MYKQGFLVRSEPHISDKLLKRGDAFWRCLYVGCVMFFVLSLWLESINELPARRGLTMKNLRTYPRIYYELLFIGFSIFLGMRLSGAFLPILAKDLDPSGALVGYVISAWFLARVFIEIPS